MNRCFKTVLLCFLAIVFTSHITPLFAGTFNDTVEQAKQTEKESDNLDRLNDFENRNRYELTDNSDSWTFFEFLYHLMFELYPMNVSPVIYGGYPYAPDDFITFNPVYDGEGALAWTEGRSWWCTAGGSAGVMYDGLKNPAPYGQLSLESQFFKFMGPDVDICTFSDDGDPTLIAQVGIRQSLLQFSPWTLASYVGYGNYSAWFPKKDKKSYCDSGMTAGLDLKIFPISPLTVRARVGFFGFDAGYSITDWRIGAGCMFNNLELFCEHRTFSFELDTSLSRVPEKSFRVLTFGSRLWL